MLENARTVFDERNYTLSDLCEDAGFKLVYEGPELVSSMEGGGFSELRPNLENFPEHVADFLGRLSVNQGELPFTPKKHLMYAKTTNTLDPGEAQGVEIFHFWDDKVWATKENKQTVEKGLTYFALPSHYRVNAEIEEAEGMSEGGIIFLNNENLMLISDKWGFQALRTLMIEADRLEKVE
jgi:hypothetical protein